MKFINIITIVIFASVMFFAGCEKVDVISLEYTDSSFEEITMYTRVVYQDHTSRSDVTVSSTVDKATNSVLVVVKTDVDVSQLYGMAELAKGCKVAPVGDAPAFGTVGDYSVAHKYIVTAVNGEPTEWTLTVEVTPPPPEVTEPTGFELIREDGTNKYIPFDSEFGELQLFMGKYYGHSYDGTADGYSKLADEPALNFKNTEDFSVSFWVRTTASNSDPEMLATQNWASSSNTGFTIAFRGDNWRVAVSDGSGHKADTNTSDMDIAFNDGSFHLLVVTFDRDGDMTMYQDGVEVASADMSEVGNIDSGNQIHVAQDGTGAYGSYFKGDIAGTTMYDYVLSADDIAELAN